MLTDFRPISLCNVLYRLIAKILANRLKPTLPHLIDHSQSGFIAGRSIQDNIFLIQEIVHSFSRGRKKYIILKADIEKAFDKVSWEA